MNSVNDGSTTTQTSRADAAWAVLNAAPDPEIPVLSLCDLGIVREVLDTACKALCRGLACGEPFEHFKAL